MRVKEKFVNFTHQMLWHGRWDMSVRLSGASHSVSVSLSELVGSLRLCPQDLRCNTVLSAVALGSGSALGAHLGLVLWVVDVHDVLGSSAAADGSATSGLGSGTGGDFSGIVTKGVEVVIHLGKLDLERCARDDSPVLQRLLHLGGVADQHSLLSDHLSLHASVGLFSILQILIRIVVTFSLELLLLSLEGSKLGLDLWINEVVDVLSVEHLWNLVVLPLVVLEHVLVLKVDVEDTSTSVGLLDITGEQLALWVILIVLLHVLDSLWDESLSDNTVHWSGDMDTCKNITKTSTNSTIAGGAGLELLSNTICDQSLAGSVLDLLDTLFGCARQLEHLNVSWFKKSLELSRGLGVQIFWSHHINLVDDNEDELVGEKWLDGLEQGHLGSNSVATLLGKIHEVEDGGSQVSDSSDGLHLNGVHLLKRVIENTWGIDGLEAEVLVIEVADEQGLGGESVWLNIDIGSGDTSQERGLSDVWITADQEGSGVWVYRWETSQMLADLIQVQERILKTLADGGHASKGGALELLALEERLRILEQAYVISGNSLDQMLRRGQLAESDAEMVGIVEGVEKILVEWMDILESWESVENERNLLAESLLCELDLAGVEVYSCQLCAPSAMRI